MMYVYFKLTITVLLGLYLLVFRKQFARWQKRLAENGKGAVHEKLRNLSNRHLELVALFGGLICLAAAALTVIELLSL